jgi:hypothetical protein
VSRARPTDVESFRGRGYVVVKGLLDPVEATRLRQRVIETFAEMETNGRVVFDPGREGTIRMLDRDLLGLPSLRHVLLDRRLQETIGELLGGEPTYFADSSVRIGANGLRLWHRDNVNRERRRGSDWSTAYPLLRCGLYLQDHADHSGGLTLRPYSHATRRWLPTVPRYINSKAGDLVAWNMRTVHCGEAVRLRGVPRFSPTSRFPPAPRLQSLTPKFMRLPEEDDRIIIFMAFGLAGVHLDNYVHFLRTHHQVRRGWALTRLEPEVWGEVERAGLLVQRPVPEYGTPPGEASRSIAPVRPARTAALLELPEALREGAVIAECVAELLTAIAKNPSVAALAVNGYDLMKFATPRLGSEIARLLRRWAREHRADDASGELGDDASCELVGDPGGPSKLAQNAIDELRRQAMRGVAAVSRQTRVRVAAATPGAVGDLLATLPTSVLREADLAVLPFPGLEDGSGLRFALRRRVPLLTAYGPWRRGPGIAVRLPERLQLLPDSDFDRALTALVASVLTTLAPEHDRAVRALGGLHATHELRALVLSDLQSSASRLLLSCARDRGLRVAIADRQCPGGLRILGELTDDTVAAAVAASEAGPDGAPRLHGRSAPSDALTLGHTLSALAA